MKQVNRWALASLALAILTQLSACGGEAQSRSNNERSNQRISISQSTWKAIETAALAHDQRAWDKEQETDRQANQAFGIQLERPTSPIAKNAREIFEKAGFAINEDDVIFVVNPGEENLNLMVVGSAEFVDDVKRRLAEYANNPNPPRD